MKKEWLSSEVIGVVGISLLLAVAIVPPLIFLFTTSLYERLPDGSLLGPTLKHFVEIFASGKFWSSLLNSAVFSCGSAICAIVIGGVQAWLAERTDSPFRGLLYLTAFVSLGVPYVLYIVAWLLLLGRAGSLNLLSQQLFGFPLMDVYSMGGMILVEAMIWSPLAFLLLTGIFRNADASFEEAAMTSGANVFGTFRHITLGMSRPALAALGLLVFIKAFEAFEVPALVGLPGKVHVLTTEVYTNVEAYLPPRFGPAAAFAVILLILLVGLLRIYSRIAAEGHKYRSVTGKGFRTRRIELGPWRWLAGAIVLLFVLVIIVLPLLVTIWAALMPFYQPFRWEAVHLVTLENFTQVWNSESFRDSILNSLILGVSVATAVTGICAVAGWLVARQARGSAVIDQLSSMPLIFPAIVISMAFLQLFINLGALYGSLLSLVIASCVAYLPYGMRYAQLGVIQIHPELEEAAGIAGASRWTGFLRIVFPLMMPALISCWLFIFLLAVRAVSMVLLLVGPNSQIVAVALFDLWNNGQIGEVAALGLIWTAIMTFVAIGFLTVGRRYGILLK